MIQLVVPMAGLGTRFRGSKYKEIKPLIPIHGIPMVQVVLANLFDERVGRIVVITTPEISNQIDFEILFVNKGIETRVVMVNDTTEGPADSVRLAFPHLDEKSAVVIANSDQYLASSLSEFYRSTEKDYSAGTILAMEDKDPKWSYIEIDELGKALRVKEKEVISNLATVGVYGFSNAKLLKDSFSEMWKNCEKVNGEYYVAPAYNYLIKHEYPIEITNLGPIANAMFGLGVPTDLDKFLELPISRYASEAAQLFFS